ncbi:autotransporter family protein [Pseudomonas vancouverensis]|uniref:Autotransporter outer membrane beta-barrel domain-containing protein n=1 Tax=Pseudomonas vancouverensis TaxID=95300 RepID=A0A1H2NJZ4_PSEVA|nr:autotransporter outer membrane beta-barrel domain-containing protein [Pseudomonas vancouverensis]KAB0495087.1 autotransporter outer membrane beta-barrel domain-containing protein [Pseudomonas vancouverensis]TDB63873.1 autotransporter outer membrane beta-barrel domain-containing protein [Pseudomonas vancouverensis]SDV05395.1 outer membrane autotransporter barrel domain-containing protein [Pseudomonas vancouverensis]
MDCSTARPKYRYSACLLSIWLSTGWSPSILASCTLVPTAGNDSFVCDSASSGPLTDLSGNNSLTFPANGSGTINGNVTFGAGNDVLNMSSGSIVGSLNQGNGANTLNISAGQITGAVTQGAGIDTFIMSGGTIQSLAQGDGRDNFLMTGGTIVGAFEDGDVARMTGGSIGRVDMKLDNNIFDLSGGQIIGNLVTGLGNDTIIVSGGRIGGNISISSGNDSVTVTGGEIVGQIREGFGNDTFVWDGGGIIRSAVLLEDGTDTATLRNLTESTLALPPSIDGGTGSDLLTFDHTTTAGAGRYVNWETVNLSNNSRFDLDGTFRLGDSGTGTGVFSIDASSTLTSVQGSIAPFTAGRLATLNNAGSIDLASGNTRTNDTLTVQGNYAGNGGQLLLQSQIGDDSSPSDKLVVNNGTLTGNTLIIVSNIGGVGALTQQNGIQLVQAQGTAVSDNNAFSLKTPVSADAFDYYLFKGGVTPGSENSWYLRSSVVAAPLVAVPNPDPTLPPILVPLVQAPVAAAGTPALPAAEPGAAPIPLYRPEVPTWSVMPPAAAQLALSALGTFHNRQGDQSLLTETGALSAGWGRVYGKNLDQTWAGTVTPELDGSLNGFQVGNDLFSVQLANGQTSRTGFFVGHSRLQGDVDGFNEGFQGKRAGSVDLEGNSLGLYWTLIDPAGVYLDTVAMYTWLNGDSHSERGLKIDSEGHVVSLSMEAGYPLAVTDNWVVEPQSQLVYQKVSLDSQDDGISRVSFDSDAAWTGRLGARLKGRYSVAGRALEPYLRANLWHTFSGDDTVTFDHADAIKTRQQSSSADVGVGLVLSLAASVSLYGGIDYTSNIDSNQQRGTVGNLGIRVSW